MKSIVFFGEYSCGITGLISNIMGKPLWFPATFMDDIKAYTTNDSIKGIIIGEYENAFPVISVNVEQSSLDEVVLFEMHNSYNCEGLNNTQKEVLQRSDAFFLVVNCEHCVIPKNFDSFYVFTSASKSPINLIVTMMDRLSEADCENFMNYLKKKIIEELKTKGVVVDRLYYTSCCISNKRNKMHLQSECAIQEEWIESDRMKEIINRVIFC